MGATFPLQCPLVLSICSLLFAHHWAPPALRHTTNCHQLCTMSHLFPISAVKLLSHILYPIFWIDALIFYMFISCLIQEGSGVWRVSLILVSVNDYFGGGVFCYTTCIIIVDFLSYYPGKPLVRVYYYIKLIYAGKLLLECRFSLILFLVKKSRDAIWADLTSALKLKHTCVHTCMHTVVVHTHTTPCFALTPSKVDMPDTVELVPEEALPSLASS